MYLSIYLSGHVTEYALYDPLRCKTGIAEKQLDPYDF